MVRTPPSARLPRGWKQPARAGLAAVLVGACALSLPTLSVSAAASPSPTPPATEAPVPLDEPSRPVRVWVPSVGIDLPVISSDRNVPGNPRGYPLCDVAQYWTRFDLPGQPGTAWIVGHAQEGMFLPLYEATFLSGEPRRLVGELIKLQLRDRRLLTYRIVEVRPASGSTDVSIAERPNRRQHRLVLQTSTGVGSAPKLELAARLVDAAWTDEPRPVPQPRACWQPPPARTPGGGGPGKPTPDPGPVEVDEPDDQIDLATLALGSGAVLLGTTLLAVYIVRRP